MKAVFSMFGLSHDLTLESFQLCLLVVFDRNNNSKPKEHFSQKPKSSLGILRAKGRFSGNPNSGCSVLGLHNVLLQL